MTVRCPRSSVRRISRALLLALGAAAALACSSSSNGSAPGSGSNATPPSLSNLSLWPPTAGQGDGGGSVLVSFSAVVSDAGADVTKLVIAVHDADGTEIDAATLDVQNPPGMTNGTIGGQFAARTTVIAEYTVQVSVVDSGGRGSNVLEATFSIVAANPVPAITSLSPESVQAGAPSFTLAVTGSGFVPSSTVMWNGSMLPTTFVDGSTLLASVPQYDLYQAGTAQIAVTTPPPGGGTSRPAMFSVTAPPPNPAPTLTALAPTSVEAGSGPFTLTVTGSGFTPWSYVVWNYGSLVTTYVDSSTLHVDVPSYYTSSVGSAQVSVSTPAPGGGTTGTLPFAVTRPVLPGVTIVGLAASDLAWDPYQRKIYVAVPSSSAVNPNTITVLDPYTGELTASQYAGSDPRSLAISDDGELLYAALAGASFVHRFALPAIAQDLAIPLGRDPTYGAYYARDVQVAPAAARTIAVSLAATGYYGSYQGLITVFDDASPRPTSAKDAANRYGALQWGADATVLYGTSDGGTYSNHLYTFSVDGAGLALANDYANAFSYVTRIHFDPGTGLLYGDEGHAVQPASGMVVGTFGQPATYSASTMVPDAALGLAFFAAGPNAYGQWVTVRSFDLDRFVATQSTTLSYVGGFSTTPSRLIRWGTDGLAFIVGTEIVLVRGAAVLPPSPTPNPVPAATSLSPASATAGGGNLRLTVKGSGFVLGSVAQWNGSERTTRFVSSTELVAFIPASDVGAAGSATITVASPEPGGGVSGGVTFDVEP